MSRSRKEKRGSILKKFLIGLGVIGGVLGIVLGVSAARFEAVIRPNVWIGTVHVSGLSKEEAAKKVRIWWDGARVLPLKMTNPMLLRQPGDQLYPTRCGVVLDDANSIAQVPLEDFWDSLQRTVGLENAPEKRLEPIFKFEPERLDYLKKFVQENAKPSQPAKVRYENDVIIKEYEIAGLKLDESKIFEAALAALKNNNEGELPLTQAEKKIPDQKLDRVKEIVTSFSTRFSTGKVTRCSNIKLASGKINGTLLAPGESFSFNTVVGRRTLAGGFKIAGVYKDGKHDFDVGGGICQVSTTLYNAVLLSRLKVSQRSNHSMPVPYVPLGQDATVDYGSHDLVFTNTFDFPIAIFSKYEPGKLTFMVAGEKEAGISVKIVRSGARTYSRGVKYVHDGGLAPGKQKVVEKGGLAGSVHTFRVVFKDGVEISREPLGLSVYRGAQKIIAVNQKAASTEADPAAPDPAGNQSVQP